MCLLLLSPSTDEGTRRGKSAPPATNTLIYVSCTRTCANGCRSGRGAVLCRKLLVSYLPKGARIVEARHCWQEDRCTLCCRSVALVRPGATMYYSVRYLTMFYVWPLAQLPAVAVPGSATTTAEDQHCCHWLRPLGGGLLSLAAQAGHHVIILRTSLLLMAKQPSARSGGLHGAVVCHPPRLCWRTGEIGPALCCAHPHLPAVLGSDGRRSGTVCIIAETDDYQVPQ